MKLYFKQRLFSWLDSYDIYNEAGETVYGANGLAALCDTISYELLCSVSKRVPRYYSEE